jgi:hypothetical protein
MYFRAGSILHSPSDRIRVLPMASLEAFGGKAKNGFVQSANPARFTEAGKKSAQPQAPVIRGHGIHVVHDSPGSSRRPEGVAQIHASAEAGAT